MREFPWRQMILILALILVSAEGFCAEQEFYRPSKQFSAPKVAWVRSVAPGLCGNIIAKTDGVYIWYKTQSRVARYSDRGKLIWDKRFVPKGRNSWTSVFANSKGDIYVSRLIGEEAAISKLLPNGNLSASVKVRRDQALAIGASAVTASGGWVTIETKACKLREPKNGQNQPCAYQYVTKYSPDGKCVWTKYLQDILASDPKSQSVLSATLDMALDTNGNTFVLKGDAGVDGIENARLIKISSNNSAAWDVDVPVNADAEMAVRPDGAGNVYVVGQKNELGYQIAKISSSGKMLWVRQPISATNDVLERVALDASGCVYVSGRVTHSLNSPTFVSKHDSNGQLVWRKTLPHITSTSGLAAQNGVIYVSGTLLGKGQMRLMKLGESK